MTELTELAARLADFAREREWDQFHTPKNLAMALAGETGELLAELQWLTPEESTAVMSDTQRGQRIRDEVADVMIYLVRLADVLSIDLVEAAYQKIEVGEHRYTADLYRGRADKAPHGD